MKRVLTLAVIMMLTFSLTQNSFGQAKGRPNKSSTATPGKVKAKKKGKKPKGTKRIKKSSKRKTTAVQKVNDRYFVSIRKREEEIAS